ncbi:Ku protein [Gemmatimonas groenlandica]|uniref:Non-homologous end joining protein Ku n=1 Tax=Gemmatimonas groenlandica TaxID=2732249 RepID=A0A6M4IL80_9BACT|nr:Ku protein [Gemmatimonas groenlandica]QJR34287.1 Ku protein [Gemmatimonas groenlandica]
MAPIWKGSISFGLVNIPVELAAAVRADNISFRMLDAETGSPVKYERVRASDGSPVPWEEIVKGFEYAKGQYIVLTEEDFKKAALESSKTIDICDFVDAKEIDPRFFETPYFMLPSKGGERGYALLREAMREGDVVGIGKIIMRKNQHLAGIHVVGDALVLELMRFSAAVVDASKYTFPPATAARPQERKMAVQLVKSMQAHFDAEKYTDDYRANLMRIIKARSKGKPISFDAPPPDAADGKVLDLMSMLKQSLTKKSGVKKVAARKAATKKARKSA